MDTLTVKLPAPLASRLRALAKERGATKSQLAREAIEKLLRTAEAAAPSALDAMKEYCGIVKDGPSDLSANPKYMEGFGE